MMGTLRTNWAQNSASEWRFDWKKLPPKVSAIKNQTTNWLVEAVLKLCAAQADSIEGANFHTLIFRSLRTGWEIH